MKKRKLMVHYTNMGPNYIPVPTIQLKGKWLEKEDFIIGEYVEVKIKGDTITLTKTTPPPTKETLNEKLMKLTKKQREKLLNMIEEKEN